MYSAAYRGWLKEGVGAVVGTETLWALLSPFPQRSEALSRSPVALGRDVIPVPRGSGYGCVSLCVLWSPLVCLLKEQGAVTDRTATLLVSAPGWLASLNSAPSQSSGRGRL